MKSTSAQTLGIVLVVLVVLMATGLFRLLFWIPLGVADGVGHGLRSSFFERGGSWFWPWAGFAGFFGVILLFFWIAVVIWVYRDAEKRRMEGVIWALIVFFTHLIGLIVYAIVRSNHPVPQSASTASPSSPPPPPQASVSGPVCKSCGKPVEKDHSYCAMCGEKLHTVCAKCGKEIQRNWTVCPFCGDKI